MGGDDGPSGGCRWRSRPAAERNLGNPGGGEPAALANQAARHVVRIAARQFTGARRAGLLAAEKLGHEGPAILGLRVFRRALHGIEGSFAERGGGVYRLEGPRAARTGGDQDPARRAGRISASPRGTAKSAVEYLPFFFPDAVVGVMLRPGVEGAGHASTSLEGGLARQVPVILLE